MPDPREKMKITQDKELTNALKEKGLPAALLIVSKEDYELRSTLSNTLTLYHHIPHVTINSENLNISTLRNELDTIPMFVKEKIIVI